MLRRTYRRLRAVTGAELLIVTGLITGMVAGSNYRQAMDRAREAVMKNNLRQFYMLVQMDGRLPEAAFYPKDPKKDRDSLLKKMPQAAGLLSVPHHPDKLRKAGLSYLYNDELAGKPLGRIDNAGKTWLLMEATILDPDLRDQRGARFMVLFADGSTGIVDGLPKDLARKLEEAKEED